MPRGARVLAATSSRNRSTSLLIASVGYRDVLTAQEPSSFCSVQSSKTLRELKKKCGRVIAAADTDTDGTWRLHGSFTADAAAAIRSRLEAECEQVFKEARTDGRREGLDAYMADALVRLCQAQPNNGNDGGNGAAPRREMVIHIDLAALRPGRTLSGKTCEIAGIGGIPAEVARDLMDDAFI